MGYLADRLLRLSKGLVGRADPVILMYHRVAEARVDPWGLAVSPDHFAEQMRELKRWRRPVPLDEMAARAVAGTLEPGTVAITFDDAYRDVLVNAKPVLEALGIPATVFVVTGELGNERGFWWDRLAEAVFGGMVPESLPDFAFMAGTAGWRTQDREALHMALWRVIRKLPREAREAAADEVAAAFGGAGEAAPVMTREELERLGEGGLISIGAHTVSHPSLPSLSAEEQREESAQSKAALEAMLGAPIRRLAYPFGDYDARTLAIAQELGFDHAVSVEAGSVSDGRARFRLPRHDVKNWGAEEFRKRLRWWM
ncbi:MAG: polysaccharide deacetylase family protein [Sphingomonadales bacterium]|nr:polysaccharide deacetylase family protein [Sphingomonadales bacterium]